MSSSQIFKESSSLNGKIILFDPKGVHFIKESPVGGESGGEQ